MARRYALAIGISTYKSLTRLATPSADAEAIAQLLEAHGDFQEVKRLPESWNVQKQHYQVGSEALKGDSIWDALEDFLLTQAKHSDALIYFSGHGIAVESRSGKHRGYLASSDCEVLIASGKVVEQKFGIDLEDFAALIQKSQVSSLVVLLDCCHAGAMIENPAIQQFLSAFNQKDYCMIAACRAGEPAFEGRQHSFFTAALLQGLSPDRADKQGQITGDRLFEFIRQELRQSGQEPIRSIAILNDS